MQKLKEIQHNTLFGFTKFIKHPDPKDSDSLARKLSAKSISVNMPNVCLGKLRDSSKALVSQAII
jgi:hypothetical protein